MSSRLSIPIVLILVPMLALPGAAPAASKSYRISAAQLDPEKKWVPVEELAQTRSDVSFKIRFLEPPQRRKAIHSVLGRELDLFPGRVDEMHPGYLVFIMQVDNGSREDVHFNPGHTRLVTSRGDIKFALDYSALFEVTRPLGNAAPSMEEMASAVFDRAVTITPKGSVRKLLAFEAPREDSYKTFEVQIFEVNVGTTAENVVFPFRKFFEDR